jgi:O-antigen/teichoic acid export membrane protein
MKEGILKIRDYIVGRIATGNPRSVRAKQQILYSFGLKGISILIGLIYVPLLLDYLDSERYGIWLTMASIIGWFEFFDIGLGNGLRNKFTEATTTGKHELAKIYVSTTYAILTAVFTIVLILFYIVNPFLNWAHILNTAAVPARELSILALIVFTFFMLRFIFKIIGIILMADQRPAVNNSFGPIGNIITLIILLILIKTTKEGSLLVLGILLSAIPVIVLIIMTIFFFNGKYKKYRPSLKFVNFKYSRDLMSLSSKFFLIQIAAVVFFTTSNIIITQVLGPQEVTVYNIAYKYFTLPVMVYSIVMTPMWSAVTEAYIKEDISWLKNILNKLNIISVVFVAGVLVMLLLSGFVYKIWIGNRVSIPFMLSSTMAFYAIITVVLAPYSQYINGFGKLKLTTIVGIFQVIVFIPLAIILAKTRMGAAGVMLATCLINGLGLILEPLQIYKILNNRANGIWNK